jgi:hypothetical protein
MDALADIDECYIHTCLPYITHHHPSDMNGAQAVFVLAVTSFVALLAVLPVLQMRTLSLAGKWGAFAMTHPFLGPGWSLVCWCWEECGLYTDLDFTLAACSCLWAVLF